ncbi:MAG: hypothetical protein PVH88_02130 [Ignavibacteria bacterium]|jgi:hypothetical protein
MEKIKTVFVKILLPVPKFLERGNGHYLSNAKDIIYEDLQKGEYIELPEDVALGRVKANPRRYELYEGKNIPEGARLLEKGVLSSSRIPQVTDTVLKLNKGVYKTGKEKDTRDGIQANKVKETQKVITDASTDDVETETAKNNVIIENIDTAAYANKGDNEKLSEDHKILVEELGDEDVEFTQSFLERFVEKPNVLRAIANISKVKYHHKAGPEKIIDAILDKVHKS